MDNETTLFSDFKSVKLLLLFFCCDEVVVCGDGFGSSSCSGEISGVVVVLRNPKYVDQLTTVF